MNVHPHRRHTTATFSLQPLQDEESRTTNNWDEDRKAMFSTERPPGWPDGVRDISLKGVGFLGVHEKTGELYWDGRKVVVRKPVTLGGFERFLAACAAASAVGLLVIEAGRSAGWWAG